MNCDMCGKQIDKLIKIKIDGAILNVCYDCSKFGEPVEKKKFNNLSESITIKFPEKKIVVPSRNKPFKKPAAKNNYRKRENIENMEIVDDYAQLIKNKREQMSMTQDDLAKKIFERKNVLSNIERGELMPNISTAKKLEKILDVKLIERE